MSKETVQKQLSVFLASSKSPEGLSISDSKIADLVTLLLKSEGILIDFSKKNPLSQMETITISLVVLGLCEVEISQIFSISLNTVKTYIDRIKNKLSVSCKLSAIVAVLRIGIIKFSH